MKLAGITALLNVNKETSLSYTSWSERQNAKIYNLQDKSMRL